MSMPPMDFYGDSNTPKAAVVNRNQRAMLAAPTIVRSSVAVVTHAKAASAASTVAVCAETHNCWVDHDSGYSSTLYNDEAMIDDGIEDEMGDGKQDLATCKRTLFEGDNEAAHQQGFKFPRLTGDETMLEDGSFTSVDMNGYTWASNPPNASGTGPPSDSAKIPGVDDDEFDTAAVADTPEPHVLGTRVRSADGWTMVYPGDYVVHPKYGVGRVLLYTLSDEDLEDQRERRAELLFAACKDHVRLKGRRISSEDLEAIRSKFGTEEDTDPISNPPRGVLLHALYRNGDIRDHAKMFFRFQTAGASAEPPKLSTLCEGAEGKRWTKTMKAAEKAAMELAQDFLALFATRKTLTRTPFDRALEPLVEDFEASFALAPTRDQQRCFDDVKTDMLDINRPMDRLVCGDVGFGKTEVAIRALYRCVINGKQAAFLAPTGVLAAQHYKNLLDRIGRNTKYDLSIGLLRGGMGKKTKEGREMRDAIRLGRIKLIVGTHALLCGTLFQDLGLLVVDEEQRFGVKQKEQLKLHFNGVDALTLSATPIPRTMQMSLRGIRDTTTIRTPPPNRQRPTICVAGFSEHLVEQAIQVELDRQGQCYYVVPRTDMFEETEKMIRELFPAIRIIQAHGRMKDHGADENLVEFTLGKYDVLLTTTLIEVGVDIANASTILVHDSQLFGLSTLYQLKGRVGRSSRQGHAYFLQGEHVSHKAGLRLQAILESRDGFEVAARDLAIRGSGMLFGTMQSGALSTKIGFDLFTRLLNKHLRRLQEMDLQLAPQTKALLPFDISPKTFRLPVSYVADDTARLGEESKARLASQSTSSLAALAGAWKETYRPLPDAVQKQLDVLYLYSSTRRLGIDLVGLVPGRTGTINDGGTADCVLRAPGLRPRHWAALLAELPNKMRQPRGLNIVFPARFAPSHTAELHLVGGNLVDERQLRPKCADEDEEEAYWDDQDAMEADYIVSSVADMGSMTQVLSDIEQYP